MECPCAHEWYELERGAAPREDAQRLSRHLAECPGCRTSTDGIRDLAASLERLAGTTRSDLSADAAESVFRRARVRGLLGRRLKTSIAARVGRTPWLRVMLPLAAAAAALVLAALGFWTALPQEIQPRGALKRLVRSAHGIRRADRLRHLAPVARAAVSEELARREPSAEQVADLLLVAYIAERPREDRQAADVDFLLGEAWRRGRMAELAAARPSWPMLASTVLAGAEAEAPSHGRTLAGDYRERPLAAARNRVLDGDYQGALEVLPGDGSGAVLKAWCLASLGRQAEAALVLSEAEDRADGPMARILRADVALGTQNVADAMAHYETLATENDHYWFAAGYLYRYELRDARGAGERFQRVRDGRMATYVTQAFHTELAMAEVPEPEPLVSVEFDNYSLGTLPKNWALVRVKGGEFEVVAVPGGKALVQGKGTEFVCGEPEWADYTIRMDVKVLASDDDFTVGAAAYRRADRTGYALQLTPQRLQIAKQYASGGPDRAPLIAREHRLVLPPAEGWWYTLKVRVQRVDAGVSVAGKVWRSDLDEPLGWHVIWTDSGQAESEPLEGGRAGVQVRGAKVLVDNLVITRNVASNELVAVAP